MDEKKLTWRDYIFIGSMLFGLFFGAGNLIFPVHMGQEAGANLWITNLGFLITGVGLPFLGVIAIGASKSEGLYDLALRVGPRFAKFFTVLLYLTIGPIFSLPRTASVSFEVGLKPYLNPNQFALFLAIFTICFFIISFLFARKPTKILIYVGKILNPLFLVSLSILLVTALLFPMGDIQSAVVHSNYHSGQFFAGFREGYNTMDGLASLAFGIIVVNTLRQMGVKRSTQIAKDTLRGGAIGMGLMVVIYTALSYMGATSRFPLSENGGIALAELARHYFGGFGGVLLALIVILACLKTAVGVTTACAETFTELFPRFSYQQYIVGLSLFSCFVANLGLTEIIAVSVPVLMFLYPLSIALILLGLTGHWFEHDRRVYVLTIAVTMIPAIVDGLVASPTLISKSVFVHFLAQIASYLPFFSVGMSWLFPTLLAFVAGLIWHKAIPRK